MRDERSQDAAIKVKKKEVRVTEIKPAKQVWQPGVAAGKVVQRRI